VANAAGHLRGPTETVPDWDVAMRPLENTTIGVIATNAALDKTECFLVAQSAHHGIARAFDPSHTRFDGDAVVAAATGEVPADVDRVRYLAAHATEAAIRQGVA
jgi:L-aminopeptidase/D-esterase-like protein